MTVEELIKAYSLAAQAQRSLGEGDETTSDLLWQAIRTSSLQQVPAEESMSANVDQYLQATRAANGPVPFDSATYYAYAFQKINAVATSLEKTPEIRFVNTFNKNSETLKLGGEQTLIFDTHLAQI